VLWRKFVVVRVVVVQRKGEFSEGVRALLVDKDKDPKWNVATLEEVEQAEVDSYFEKDGIEDLQLD
jgi:enoyl-CoA hydratase